MSETVTISVETLEELLEPAARWHDESGKAQEQQAEAIERAIETMSALIREAERED